MEEESKIMLQPGQRIKPFLLHETVKALVSRLYNLEVTSIKELNSYDDRNFHITVKDVSSLPDPEDASPSGYVFKVLNSLDSKSENFVSAQNEMMIYLRKHEIPCPKPVKNVHGKVMSMEILNVDGAGLENCESEPTGQHIVRLLTYLPGSILFSVDCTKELIYRVGEMVSKLDLTLKEFHHKGIFLGIDRIWNLNAVPKMREFVFAVDDKEKRSLAMEVIENFESSVVPHYPALESGPIHGDLNDQNILVRESTAKTGNYFVAGILDFGDIHHNFYLFELAITICYIMTECKSIDFLDAPGYLLAGYRRFRPIPEKEFDLLKDCIAGRFCQDLVLGAYSYSQNPDPYLIISSKKGWDCLKSLWKCPNEQLKERWRTVMDHYNLPS